MWYDLDDDGSLVFNTGESTVKGRNLPRDPGPPCASTTIDHPSASWRSRAWSRSATTSTEVRHWATRIGGRYMGADRADEFGARNGVPGELLVRLRPARIVSAFDAAD